MANLVSHQENPLTKTPKLLNTAININNSCSKESYLEGLGYLKSLIIEHLTEVEDSPYKAEMGTIKAFLYNAEQMAKLLDTEN